MNAVLPKQPPSPTLTRTHTQSATHTHTRTFNRTSTPSVAGRVLYPHYDLPTPPLIAYQVAPLPQPAAAPPFPQRCNYFRELPRGHKQLRSYVLVRVHVRACTCIHLQERASVKLNTNNCVCVHMCVCVCVWVTTSERQKCVCEWEICVLFVFQWQSQSPCRQSGWLTGLTPRRWPSH